MLPRPVEGQITKSLHVEVVVHSGVRWARDNGVYAATRYRKCRRIPLDDKRRGIWPKVLGLRVTIPRKQTSSAEEVRGDRWRLSVRVNLWLDGAGKPSGGGSQG